MVRLALGSPLDYKLNDVETGGDPEDVAAIHMNLSRSESDYIIGAPRASSIYGACMRMHALATVMDVPVRQRLSMGEKITFGIGRAVHELFQNSSEFIGDNKYGYWKCLACDNITEFTNTIPDSCSKCRAKSAAFKYHELYVKTESPYICSGHPDLFIKPAGLDLLRVVEIKTIASDAFKKLEMPLIAHTWQLAYYQWACSEDPTLRASGVKVDPLVAYCVYISKGALWNKLPMKMFPVKRQVDILNQIKNKLRLYSECIHGDSAYPPVRQKCEFKFKNNEPVRDCPVHVFCKQELESQ